MDRGLLYDVSITQDNLIVPEIMPSQVEYQNIDGQKVVTKFEGRPAVIFQHEYDHLDKVLKSQFSLTCVPRYDC